MKRRRIKNASSILFISTSNPLYLFRFQSTPLGDQWADYFEWQLKFIEALSLSKRRVFIYRPYPIDQGLDITTQVEVRWPETRIHRGPLSAALGKSRLVVLDHCGTTLLEVLAANIPTVAYWDFHRWEIREDAMPLIELLIASGILWSSPEDAAHAVEEVYDQAEGWWNGYDIQAARRAFVERFALQSRNWIDAWKDVE